MNMGKPRERVPGALVEGRLGGQLSKGAGGEAVVGAAGAGLAEDHDEFWFGGDDIQGGAVVGGVEVGFEGGGEGGGGGVVGKVVHQGGGGDVVVAGLEEVAPVGFSVEKHRSSRGSGRGIIEWQRLLCQLVKLAV